MSILRRPGRESSRIEGFSDAVFGFALTLLVVSLEVPRSFAELVETMQGFLAFAICFAFIVWIWVEHYQYFRRFSLADGWTIFLNSALLFVVLFYVYPLKFLFTALVHLYTGLGPGYLDAGGAFRSGRELLRLYSTGFTVVFLILAALYLHAYRSRRRLGLDDLGVHDSRAGMLRHGATAAVGVLSLLLTVVLPPRLTGFAGIVFAILGPIHGGLGYYLGRRREALVAQSSTAAATPST